MYVHEYCVGFLSRNVQVLYVFAAEKRSRKNGNPCRRFYSSRLVQKLLIGVVGVEDAVRSSVIRGEPVLFSLSIERAPGRLEKTTSYCSEASGVESQPWFG